MLLHALIAALGLHVLCLADKLAWTEVCMHLERCDIKLMELLCGIAGIFFFGFLISALSELVGVRGPLSSQMPLPDPQFVLSQLPAHVRSICCGIFCDSFL